MRCSWILDIFFLNGEGGDCFWQAKVLPRLSKIIYLPKVVKTNEQDESWFTQNQQNNYQFWTAQWQKSDYQFWTAQCQQNGQFENPYITSHGEARSIRFKQQGKCHSKGFIEYPTSEETDVITPYLRGFEKSLYL